MRILVFQHIKSDHPGILGTCLSEHGLVWDTVELDQGDLITDLNAYDALWVMGGPMDVWEIDKYPWLLKEKEDIRYWVKELKRPFLGLCLGHQLLADALGGKCAPQDPPEIGIFEVQLNENGINDPIFNGIDEKQFCLQWHSVKVTEPPKNALVLASSPLCEVQAMKVGNHAWSMQYHVEVEPDTIDNWIEDPVYRASLEKSIGKGGLNRINKQTLEMMPYLNSNCRKLFSNFLSVMKQC